MTIETQLNRVLESLLLTRNCLEITTHQLIESIDLTLLKENAKVDELAQINHLAQYYPVAAVCIYAHHFPHIAPVKDISFATVINFPTGNASIEACIAEINQAIRLGFKEIDYVFPYQLYLAEKRKEALAHSRIVSEYCEQIRVRLKIILEIGAFTELSTIYKLCIQLLDCKCDFLKTSTGKTPQGASLPAAFAILSAIQDSGKKCGIKISGGIKTPQQARNFAYLAELMMCQKINKSWFRIGASSLLEELLNKQ